MNSNNACQHQAITLTDADLSSVGFSVNHLRAISLEVPMNLNPILSIILSMCNKIRARVSVGRYVYPNSSGQKHKKT